VGARTQINGLMTKAAAETTNSFLVYLIYTEAFSKKQGLSPARPADSAGDSAKHLPTAAGFLTEEIIFYLEKDIGAAIVRVRYLTWVKGVMPQPMTPKLVKRRKEFPVSVGLSTCCASLT
jgi:hypothetical protein